MLEWNLKMRQDSFSPHPYRFTVYTLRNSGGKEKLKKIITRYYGDEVESNAGRDQKSVQKFYQKP